MLLISFLTAAKQPVIFDTLIHIVRSIIGI